MMKRILFLIVLMIPLWALGAVPVTKYTKAPELNGKYFDTNVAACQAYIAYSTDYWKGARTYIYVSTVGTTCRFNQDKGGYYEYSVPLSDVKLCADNSTPTNGVCPDPPPTPADCTDKNPMIRKFYYTAGAVSVPPNHFGFCEVVPEQMLVCRKDSVGTYCMWQVHRNGNKWDGDTTSGSGGTVPADDTDTKAKENTSDPKTTSPSLTNKPADPKICPTCVPCPTGTVQAGVDASGIPICMGTGTNPSNPSAKPETKTSAPTTTNNSDGSSTTVQKSEQTNGDGSVTTTTTTTIKGADGSVTVKQTTDTSKATSGASGKTDSANPDQNDLCKQNPMLTLCRNSSVSGTCGDIACDGDAIQCATLRATAAMQCQQQKALDELNKSSSKALGDSILAGTDPIKGDIDKVMKGTEVDLSRPQLDQSAFLGGGSCLTDRSISFMGKPVKVSFSSLCSNIQPLRAVFMACAFILAYMIVAKSVLQS